MKKAFALILTLALILALMAPTLAAADPKLAAENEAGIEFTEPPPYIGPYFSSIDDPLLDDLESLKTMWTNQYSGTGFDFGVHNTDDVAAMPTDSSGFVTFNSSTATSTKNYTSDTEHISIYIHNEDTPRWIVSAAFGGFVNGEGQPTLLGAKLNLIRANIESYSSISIPGKNDLWGAPTFPIGWNGVLNDTPKTIAWTNQNASAGFYVFDFQGVLKVLPSTIEAGRATGVINWTLTTAP